MPCIPPSHTLLQENDTEIEKLSQQEAQHPWRNTVESGLAAAREAIIQFAGLQQQPGAEMEAAQASQFPKGFYA